jgi:ABC-type branched-subunit amino acid transport system substrate-binding protein
MKEQEQKQLPANQPGRLQYTIKRSTRTVIIIAAAFSIPAWFLSEIYHVNVVVTFFSIFFTVAGVVVGLLEAISKGSGDGPNESGSEEKLPIKLPSWLSSILKLILRKVHISFQQFVKYGLFGLALVIILFLAIWNFYTDLYYRLDISFTLISVCLFLVGIAITLLYFLPSLSRRAQNEAPPTNTAPELPEQKNILSSKFSLQRIELEKWLRVPLLLILALSFIWNIGQYRIADVCDGAQAPSPLNGIGAIVQGRECIGLSDGSTIFDAARPNGDQKREAANQFRHGASRARVLSLFDEAIAADPTDAEALIYREDLWIGSSPHITIVVAATLSGLYISDGRDTLQGVYVAQKEYNDKCQQQGSDCPLLNILIANTGSGITDEAQYTHDVTVQIMQAAKKDPTIVAIMDGLASQSTFDINDEVMAHPDRILPMVGAKATSDFLTRMPHFLRVAPPNSLQAQMGAKYAKAQLQSSRIAIFYRQENTYSGNLKDDFINEYQDGGHQVVAVEAYPGRDPGVLRDKLATVLALKPDLIYCACYSNEVSVILEHLPTTGPFAHLLVLGGDAFFETGDFTPGALAHLSRLRFTALAYPEIWRALPMTNVSFFADYGKLFEPANFYAAEGFGFTRLTPGIMVAYDAMLTLTTAATRAFVTAKQAHTPQNLEHALFQMQGKQAIQGITGQISVGGNGDPINKAIVVLSIDNSNKFHCIWLYGQFLAGKPAPPDQLNNGQTCTTAAG